MNSPAATGGDEQETADGRSIHVVPAHLREAAAITRRPPTTCAPCSSSHAAIQESLDSLGPVFSELRDAGRELLELDASAMSNKPMITPIWQTNWILRRRCGNSTRTGCGP